MAIWKFLDAILNNRPIQVFAEVKWLRDFTYIDDIVVGILSIIGRLDTDKAPHLMNIGNNNPVTVDELVTELELALRQKAQIGFSPMQKVDDEETFADIEQIQ